MNYLFLLLTKSAEKIIARLDELKASGFQIYDIEHSHIAANYTLDDPAAEYDKQIEILKNKYPGNAKLNDPAYFKILIVVDPALQSQQQFTPQPDIELDEKDKIIEELTAKIDELNLKIKDLEQQISGYEAAGDQHRLPMVVDKDEMKKTAKWIDDNISKYTLGNVNLSQMVGAFQYAFGTKQRVDSSSRMAVARPDILEKIIYGGYADE